MSSVAYCREMFKQHADNREGNECFPIWKSTYVVENVSETDIFTDGVRAILGVKIGLSRKKLQKCSSSCQEYVLARRTLQTL